MTLPKSAPCIPFRPAWRKAQELRYSTALRSTTKQHRCLESRCNVRYSWAAKPSITAGGLAVLATLLFAGTSLAQQLRIQEGPYYIGENILIQVTTTASGDTPNCTWTPPAGVELIGPNIGSSTQTTIINGRVTTASTLTYSFNVVASQTGELKIGPFTIEDDGEKAETNTINILLQEVERDEDIILEFDSNLNRVYEGQLIPAELRWGMVGSMSQVNAAFQDLTISSPIFEHFDVLADSPTSNQTLTLRTASGEVSIDAEAARQRKGNREAIVLTCRFSLIARNQVSLPATTIRCRTRRVLSERRTFFEVERKTIPVLGETPEFDVAILPIPTDGRPANYSGAVGRRFALETTTNRDVVRVGDPLTLEIKVSGEGPLQRLSLPSLAADPQLDATKFSLPTESPTGSFTGQAKQFKVTIRAKSSDVTEIPGIGFSWFDPEVETFRITRSNPIPIKVMDAQIVSAGSVIGSPSREVDSTESAAPEMIGDMVAANLAISSDINSLAQPTPVYTFWPSVTIFAYCLSGAAVPLAWFLAGLVRQDPQRARIASFRRELQRDIALASKLPIAEACQKISRAVNALTSQSSSTAGVTLSAEQLQTATEIVADCDRVRYSPNPESHTDAFQGVLSRAKQLLQEAL